MSKRNPGQTRQPRDFYPTPEKAVLPVLPFLQQSWAPFFYEPCAGEGDLISHLYKHGFRCVGESEIAKGKDAFKLTKQDVDKARFLITNPPWTRDILHPMIEHLVSLGKPVWLLLDADWMHTKQASNLLLSYGRTIVSVGRVRWIKGSKMDGYDNAAWYEFRDQGANDGLRFVPRKV